MRTVKVIKYLFPALGLVLLVGALVAYSSTKNFLTTAVIAEGTVIQLVRSTSSDSTTYRPVVEFNTQSGTRIEFTSSSGSNPPSYSQGETVEVLYQESSPNQAKINGFFSLWGLPTILGVMGSVFFVIGTSVFLFGTLNTRKITRLKKSGTPIVAKFQSVEVNGSLEVNGRNPYQICAQWKNPATSELHIFNSENIWFDPTDHISQEEITVLIEEGNPSNYYVDVSFLPKVAR